MNPAIVEARKRQPYTFKFPADRFELVERLPDRIYEHHMKTGRVKPIKQHMVKLRCKKCGDIKDVCDKPYISCKEGLCSYTFKDRTGKQYGDLTVLKPVKTDSKYPWQWLCRCSCGKEEVISSTLLAGGKEDCSECSKLRVIKHNTRVGDGAKWSRIIRDYKKNAIARNYDFQLSYEDCMRLFKGPCIYCGDAPAVDGNGLIRNGIDRRDSSGNYTVDNTASCCAICNIMKMAHSHELFLKHVAKIHKYNKTLIGTFNDYPEREYTQAGGNGETPVV